MNDKEFADVVGTTKKIVLSAIEKHLSVRFHHAIDDIVQETYLRAYRSLVKNKFRGDSRIGTWLYSIARNEALRMNNKLTKEEEKFKKSISLFSEAAVPDDRDQHDVDYLYDAIAQLPDIYKSVMELVAGGFSVKQISKRLDIEAGTVKSRTSRGKEIMKKLLEEDRHE
jgi:RNA polymerase sigma-70 factor (ECF subfamily)